jgi:hypothetical protein
LQLSEEGSQHVVVAGNVKARTRRRSMKKAAKAQVILPMIEARLGCDEPGLADSMVEGVYLSIFCAFVLVLEVMVSMVCRSVGGIGSCLLVVEVLLRRSLEYVSRVSFCLLGGFV